MKRVEMTHLSPNAVIGTTDGLAVLVPIDDLRGPSGGVDTKLLEPRVQSVLAETRADPVKREEALERARSRGGQ